MIRFNGLLTAAQIDPSVVRLVRHRHERKYLRAVHRDAIQRNPRFEQYQAGQSSQRVIDQIRTAKVIASFVADPAGQTLFVGLWRVGGARPGYLPDPYRVPTPPAKSSSVIIGMERMDALSQYCGRIVVDWGGGERAWVQYAHRRDKEIVELRRRAEESLFPGFAHFACGLHEVDTQPGAWLEALRSSRGIYLLVHRPTGAQYVGCAVGVDGFLGRWRSYADGHGGNKAMRELAYPADEYDVRILETAGSAATPEDVYDLESLWKDKLGSRAQGLNRN